MKTFFKVFFACLLAILVVFGILIIVFLGIASSVGTSEKPMVKEKTVLYIDLADAVQEQSRDMDFQPPFSFSTEPVPGLHERIEAVYHAIGDSSVKAIYLLARGNGMGPAASEEFGFALDSFKASGKPIYAFADIMTQRAYELAHRATKVYGQPGGFFEWTGYNFSFTFFKGSLDKLEIKPEIFYAGQFKSATEPYRLTKMSEANKIQYVTYLNTIYGNLMQSIKKHRNLDSAALAALSNELGVRSPEQAFQAGLLDGVLYDDQVKDIIRKKIGLKKDADINFMTIEKYGEAITNNSSGDRLAVLYADGEIIGGKGEAGEIGADSYRSLISKLRKDSKIKGVVLRINSPGGSAIASEMIWRELALLEKEKPLVVSMGNYAASGGYYIATCADSIFAEPNTLTGSIGVFSIYIDANGLLSNKLGLSFDAVKTNNYADFGDISRPMSALERTVAQRDVDTTYALFKRRVAVGRNLSEARVDSIAQGRVWSGADAKHIGLVDEMGGLQEAIACAARMAKLDQYSIRNYPVIPTFFEKLFENKEDPNTNKIQAIAKGLAPQEAAILKEFYRLKQMSSVPQARLPFVLQNP